MNFLFVFVWNEQKNKQSLYILYKWWYDDKYTIWWYDNDFYMIMFDNAKLMIYVI